MPIGNPLLAVWDIDAVLRTYEYVGGIFIPLASVGGITHVPPSTGLAAGASPAPYLQWDRDDSYLAVMRAHAATTMVMQTFTPVLGVVMIPTAMAPQYPAGAKYDFVEPYHQHFVMFSESPRFDQYIMDAAGRLNVQQSIEGTVHYLGASDFKASPDGENIFACYSAAKPLPYMKWYRATAPTAPLYTVGSAPAITSMFSVLLENSYNGTSLITVGTGGVAKVWSYPNVDNIGSLTFLQDLAIPAGTPQKIAMSRDNMFMAISALNSGTYTTFVYQRVGEYFRHSQTLTGIGKLLEFSFDGVLLLDAGLLKCYILVGLTFEPHHTAMANIPSLVQGQSLSKGRVSPNGYSYLYEASVEWFANDGINLADLKFDLLTDAASFNENHTTINTVTNNGAYRTTTGDWPVGGKSLTGVTRTPGNGTLSIDADNLSHIAINNHLVARYAVIYEATTGRPLIWIDLNMTRTVAHGREILINFRGGELLKFSK